LGCGNIVFNEQVLKERRTATKMKEILRSKEQEKKTNAKINMRKKAPLNKKKGKRD